MSSKKFPVWASYTSLRIRCFIRYSWNKALTGRSTTKDSTPMESLTPRPLWPLSGIRRLFTRLRFTFRPWLLLRTPHDGQLSRICASIYAVSLSKLSLFFPTRIDEFWLNFATRAHGAECADTVNQRELTAWNDELDVVTTCAGEFWMTYWICARSASPNLKFFLCLCFTASADLAF